MEKFDTVDAYIDSFKSPVKEELIKIRALIKKLVPNAVETMSYGMPGYKLNGKPLVYFAGWKEHISFYPTPSGMETYREDLKAYKTGKGTAQFSLNKELPWDLIRKIVQFRIGQVEEQTKK